MSLIIILSMNSKSYTLKISSQSQITIPKNLREQLQLQPGSRIVLSVADSGELRISGKLPIEEHFGSLQNTWTATGEDAAVYIRKLRDSMQPKVR